MVQVREQNVPPQCVCGRRHLPGHIAKPLVSHLRRLCHPYLNPVTPGWTQPKFSSKQCCCTTLPGLTFSADILAHVTCTIPGEQTRIREESGFYCGGQLADIFRGDWREGGRREGRGWRVSDGNLTGTEDWRVKTERLILMSKYSDVML